MRYLLDTNIVSDLVRRPQGQVAQLLRGRVIHREQARDNMESADELKHEEIDRAEDVETLAALDEAFAELQRGEGRPLDEALPALRNRLGINKAAPDAVAR